eukprot:SAG31_NODE_8249_length_1489_cov_4.725180_1_plen_157_part_00
MSGGLNYSLSNFQFNSIQFNSIQFNSIQFNSIQFNSIQFIRHNLQHPCFTLIPNCFQMFSQPLSAIQVWNNNKRFIHSVFKIHIHSIHCELVCHRECFTVVPTQRTSETKWYDKPGIFVNVATWNKGTCRYLASMCACPSVSMLSAHVVSAGQLIH